MNKGLIFVAIGFELLAVVLVGVYLGSSLDEYMGWQGQGFLLVTGILFCGWLFHFIKLLNKFMKDEKISRK